MDATASEKQVIAQAALQTLGLQRVTDKIGEQVLEVTEGTLAGLQVGQKFTVDFQGDVKKVVQQIPA
jgi:hypothetical protein